MTPESLFEKLESLGAVDERTLAKLRRSIANPHKSSSVNQILSWLVKNKLLTRQQALDLKKPAPRKGRRQSEDDLLAGVLDSGDVPEPELADEAGDPDEVIGLPGADWRNQPELAGRDVDDVLAAPETVEEILEAGARARPATRRRHAEVPPDPMAADLDEFTSTRLPMDRQNMRVGFVKLDSRNQWSTKWPFIGFGVLGLLLVAGTLLFLVLSMISAEDRFAAANKSYKDGTYSDAVKKFTEFLEKHPSHENAPDARGILVQALLADTYKQKNWDETILRARNELPKLVADDTVDLETIRQDLAVILPTSTLEIARRATKQTDRADLVKQLENAKEARKLVDDPVYIPNSKRKQAAIAKILDALEEEIAKGDALIRKQDDFDSAIERISAFRERGEAEKAFGVYNTLIRSYGDMRANEPLQKEMRQVSELERRLVKSLDKAVPTSAERRPSPIASTSVLVSTTGSPIESLTGEVVPVLADGSVFGVDIGSGSVKWRRFVGYQTVIQPLPTDATHVLISDQAQHDLMLVKADDGVIVWRAEIGERFLDPTVDADIIFLTTAKGRLLRMDLATGGVAASVQIPQEANVSMARSSRTGVLIQPGFYSNLYLLAEDDLSCRDVFYLGHYRGSISVPPVIWNNLILVAVNQSGVCDLNVLQPTEDGVNLELIQRIRRVIRGNVTNPLQRFGRFMLITSESGDIRVLELNNADESSPIQVLAEEKFENRDSARAWVTTSGSEMWIGVKGITRYKVSRSLATFKRNELKNSDDFFVGPIRKFGDSIIHVRKRAGSALTSVSAVDCETMDPIWRTDLGGPLAGPPIVFNNKLTAVSSQGDLFTLDPALATDQAAAAAVKSSTIVENLLFDHTIRLTEQTLVCLGPPGRADVLYVDLANGTSRLIRLPPPADMASCLPVEIGGHLIIPSAQGQVLRVDPATGRIVGTPFLPPVSPGDLMDWKQPAVLAGNQLVIGAGQDFYLLDASSDRQLRKVGEMKTDAMLKSPLTSSGELVFGVLGGNATDSLVAIRATTDGLQSVGKVELGGMAQSGPWALGDVVLIQMANDRLACFDQQLEPQWSAETGTGTLAAIPEIDGDAIRIYFSDGRVLNVNAGSGEIQLTLELGQPIVHRPVISGDRAIFAGADGTIQSARLSSE